MSFMDGVCINVSRSRNLALCLVTFVSLVVLLVIHHGSNRHEGKSLVVVDDYQFQLANPFNSTCGHASDLRGPNQNVIAYSIYGDFSRLELVRKYLHPFQETLNMIPLIYPGWIVRIYHNLTKDDTQSWKTLRNLLDLKNSQHIDFCNATEIIKNRKLGDIFAMTWRWLPLLDETVDALMSRDSDSRIISREKDAVLEWLNGDRIFHIMRDHPWHCRFIVGCCWGVKISQARSTIVRAAAKLFSENHLHEYDYDQKLLDRFIWPIATKNMIAHDSYCCESIGLSQPYPTKRKGGYFIGWRAVPSEELPYPCPPKCRPQNVTSSSDWSYC